MPPSFDLTASTLWDFIPPLQLFVQTAWMKRKEFIEAFSMFNVLEYDAIDYSRICVLVKAKSGKAKILRLLELELPIEFPEKPPIMTLSEFGGQRNWKFDPSLYRYSPRWTAHRISEELFQHALTGNAQAWI